MFPVMLTWALLAGGANTLSSVGNTVHEISRQHAAALGLSPSSVDWEMLDMHVRLERALSVEDYEAAARIKSLLVEVQQRRTEHLAAQLCHHSSAMRRKLRKEQKGANATGPAALLAMIDQAVDEQVYFVPSCARA